MEELGEPGVEYKNKILVLDLKTFAIQWREKLDFGPFAFRWNLHFKSNKMCFSPPTLTEEENVETCKN